jgi:hypothetical protein
MLVQQPAQVADALVFVEVAVKRVDLTSTCEQAMSRVDNYQVPHPQ